MGFFFSQVTILIVIISLGACASAVFHSKPDLSEPGLGYYLPKTLLNVKIAVIGHPPDTKVTALGKKEEDLAGNEGAVRVSAQIDGKYHTVLVKKDGTLKTELVTSLKLVEVTPENVADLKHNYVLQYRPNVFFSDRVCMGVNTDGLLQFVEAATKDETANIILSISKLAGRFAGPQAFTTVSGPQKLRELVFKIDPFNPKDSKAITQAISNHYPQFTGRFEFHVENSKGLGTRHPKEDCPPDSICYRTAVPIRIGMVDRQTHERSVRYATVANLSEVNHVNVTRSFLVEKITRYGFRDGVLEYAVVKKPSQALAAAKLPLSVYDAVLTSALAAPGQFLGQITPGTSPQAVMGILTDYGTATKDIVSIQGELLELKNDTDQSGPSKEEQEKDKNFKITCKGPNGEGAATGASAAPLGQ